MGLVVNRDQAPALPEDWSVVSTDAGPVTLVPIESLNARAGQLTDWVAQAQASSASLRAQAEDHYAASAAILVPRRKEWAVPSAIAPDVERASSLAEAIAANDTVAADLKEHKSHGNVFGRIGAWRHERGLTRERETEATELRALLIEIAKAMPQSTLPEADAEIRAGTDPASVSRSDIRVFATESVPSEDNRFSSKHCHNLIRAPLS